MRVFLLAAILVIEMAQAGPVDNSAGLKAVNNGASQFSANFFKTLAETETGNLISSPLSVDIVLAMLSLGAQGKTLEHLQSTLSLPTDESLFKSGYENLMDSLNNIENVELKLANKIFNAENHELKPEYTSAVKDVFKSAVQSVNFANSPAAAKTINDWAAAQTNNKIQNLFKSDAFNADTALVLTNAIYFKGQWEKQFLPTNTHDAPFHIDENTVKQVPTMYKKERFNNGHLQELNARWIELPYKGKEFSLLIIMPNEINGLSKLQANLDKVNVTELLNSGNKYELELYLPKFKIESELKLKPILEKMGLSTLFTNGADLSGMSQVPLKVSDAIQKAYIEVNEEGSEAAAVTGMVAVLKSARVTYEIFKVDRPFLFKLVRTSRNDNLVRDNTPLFEGSFKDPLA